MHIKIKTNQQEVRECFAWIADAFQPGKEIKKHKQTLVVWNTLMVCIRSWDLLETLEIMIHHCLALKFEVHVSNPFSAMMSISILEPIISGIIEIALPCYNVISLVSRTRRWSWHSCVIDWINLVPRVSHLTASCSERETLGTRLRLDIIIMSYNGRSMLSF